MVWRYRALWVFGVILAVTTASGGFSSPGAGNQFQYETDGFRGIDEIPPDIVPIMIGVAIGVVCVIVFLAVVATIARWVSETALIRMVDEHEETGEKYGVRDGFRKGWSRAAFRLFLIHLLIFLVVGVPLIVLFMLAFAPLLLWLTKNTVVGVIGTVTAVGLFFLMILLAIIVNAVVGLLKHFIRRACVVEELGVVDSIRAGFGLVRRRLKEVIIMWLIMIGVQIGWGIAMMVTIVVLFPIIILLLILGAVLGGLPALLVFGLASLVTSGPVPWILAGVIGAPIFILVVAAPWIFLSGLMEVFKSSVWTLTYRELRALEDVELEPELEPGPEPVVLLEPKPDASLELEPEPEAPSELEPLPQPKTVAMAVPEPEPEPELEAPPEPEPPSQPKTVAMAVPDLEPEPEPAPEPETQALSEPDAPDAE